MDKHMSKYREVKMEDVDKEMLSAWFDAGYMSAAEYLTELNRRAVKSNMAINDKTNKLKPPISV